MLFQEITNVGLFFNWAPWIIYFPLLGLIINLLIGQRLGEKAVGTIANLAAGLAFIVAALLAYSLSVHPEAVIVPIATWISVGSLDINWAVRVDTLSVTMMLVVAGVGALIHVYSIGYMHSDVHHNGDPGRFRRFFVFLNLFIAAMMILVSADNFLTMFVGWEGVGLCSYLLIGFWFEKGENGIGNAKAAKKAFVVNRIGDTGLLIAMFLIFWNIGSLQFDQVFARAPEIAATAPGILLAITLLMLLGVTGKSAQLPLFVWLPDAMAGPTPVSALIHAATMVTAGVYLIARTHALYILVPEAQTIVAWVGGLTALFAATIAIGQTDIKRVLAYSTISQLGFMVAAVGMGAFAAGMFHLVTHAFFKALLFLSAGSVILGLEHALDFAQTHKHDGRTEKKFIGTQSGKGQPSHLKAGQRSSEASPGDSTHTLDPQNMRNMGGLRERMRTTYWVYLIGALALSGIAPLSGFFSKDEILSEAVQLQPWVFAMLVVTSFLTAFYMGRQVFMVFYGKPRTKAAERAVENPTIITLPLVMLAFLSAVGGALNLPGVHSLGVWLEHTIAAIHPTDFNVVLALITLALAALAIFLAWILYGRQALRQQDPDPLRRVIGPLFTAFEKKWWVDDLYNRYIAGGYVRLSGLLANPVDLGVIDAFGSGLGYLTRSLSGLFRRIQTGLVRSYALAVFVGAIFILAYVIFR